MDDRAEDWREIWSLERPERVPSAVVRELEAYGVRVPTKFSPGRSNSQRESEYECKL